MKQYLSETAELVKSEAAGRLPKEELALTKLSTESLKLARAKSVFDQNLAKFFDYKKFGSVAGKLPLREGVRIVGVGAGVYLIGNETAQILVKWNHLTQRLSEPTLEDIQDARIYRRSGTKKFDRKPAVLSGKNGPIQQKFLTSSELEIETSDQNAQVPVHAK